MKNNKDKIQKLSDKILDVYMLIEIVRDSSIANDYTSCEYVLNLALEKQQEIFDEIEFMY